MPLLWMLQAMSAPRDPATPALDARWHAQGCPATPGSDVVVCADRRDRYRLPLRGERDTATPSDGHVAGKAARPTGTLVSTAPCGIFAGERRCGKAEAKRYGYGGGRDPLTVATRLGTKLVDPDAELGAPAPIPPR